MVLSDTDIHKYIAQGKIKITPPLPPEQFGSCSVDFRLATSSACSSTATTPMST
jgi:deoxycytidine triphosphate deaminase